MCNYSSMIVNPLCPCRGRRNYAITCGTRVGQKPWESSASSAAATLSADADLDMPWQRAAPRHRQMSELVGRRSAVVHILKGITAVSRSRRPRVSPW
jgi:hypothetical protein